MKVSKKKKDLQKSSNRLAYASGITSSLGRSGLNKAGKFRAGIPKSKAGLFSITAGSALALASTVQNARGSTGTKDFVGREIGNLGRSFLGGLVGGGLSFAGIKAIKKARPFAKKAGAKIRNTKAKSSGKNKGVKFIRVNGRVIPVKAS